MRSLRRKRRIKAAENGPGDGQRRRRSHAVLAGGVDTTMATLSTIVRCPRCRSRPNVQSAIELRPGVEYLTVRCASCGLVYDAQMPSDPTNPRR